MIDRNRTELERLRRYHDPDDPAEAEHPRGYVKWFGIWLKEGTIFRVGFGLCFTMVALLVAKTQLSKRVEWLPSGELWFELAFLGLIMLMSFTALSMFYCGSMTFKRQIREVNARMARSDNATPDEVEEVMRQTDKRLNRQVLYRTLFCAAAVAIIYPIFGTTLIFPWGGILAFFGMVIAVMVAVSVPLYFRTEIADHLRRWLRLTRQPGA